MRRPLVLLAVPLCVCVIAAFVAIRAHESDPSFVFSQQQVARLSPATVDALVRTAPDPRGANRPRGAATCRAGHRDELENPWECRIRYPGLTARYAVRIRPNGSYVGGRLDDVGQISGCCLSLSGIR